MCGSIYMFFSMIAHYIYDFGRYWRFSATRQSYRCYNILESRIIAHCHTIEKGFSLPQVKPQFGAKTLDDLFDLLDTYIEYGFPRDRYAFQYAVSCLKDYARYFDLSDDKNHKVIDRLNRLDTKGCYDAAPCILFKKQQMIEQARGDFLTFSQSRHSIRTFSDEPVSMEILRQAVHIAQKAPSVCNRQAARVYVVRDKPNIQEVLAHQKGNRGFGHMVDKLIIVTADLASFYGPGERNQAYVDAGLFAMSLLLSLHYKGLAVCTLNWCTSKKNDVFLRKAVNINESENIILLLAVGNYADTFYVAKSPRKPLDEIFHVV